MLVTKGGLLIPRFHGEAVTFDAFQAEALLNTLVVSLPKLLPKRMGGYCPGQVVTYMTTSCYDGAPKLPHSEVPPNNGL